MSRRKSAQFSLPSRPLKKGIARLISPLSSTPFRLLSSPCRVTFSMDSSTLKFPLKALFSSPSSCLLNVILDTMSSLNV